MRNFFNTNKVFLILYFTVLLLVLPVVIIYPKNAIHLFINNFHNIPADIFFKYLTNMGSGWIVVIVSLIFLFISFRKMLILSISGIISGLAVQLFKHVFFAGYVRPIKFFEGISNLHIVDGVNMLSFDSFPSGHSASIFALCLCLSTFTNRNFWKIVLFCTAILIAFSRVYLSQHFLTDILAGSMIGIIASSITIIYFSNLRSGWMDYSLLTLNKQGRKNET